MLKRHLSQAVILSVTGILAAKGIILWRLDGLQRAGTVLTVPAAAAAAVLTVFFVSREPVRKKRLRKACILLAAFAAAAVRMWQVSAETGYQLQGIKDGEAAAVQGRIIQKKQKETESQNIQWTVCLTDSYLKTEQEIRSCGNIILYLSLDAGEPVIGNTIIVEGNIILFREARNDGNFDERAHYQNQGYSLKFYADDASYQVKDTHTDRMREFLYGVQQKLSAVYRKAMPQKEAGALAAMLLGEKSQLFAETKELYRQSGIAHILAISGLHISVLGAAVCGVLRKTGASYPVSSAVSMGLLMAFGFMTGMGTSAVRAVLMFGIYLGAACCGRAYDSMSALAAAGAWILLQNPRVLFLAGFQFSFAAVAGVLLGKEICRIFSPKYRLTETVLVSLSIQALTLPLTAWYYYEIPVYSVLLNLFVLPFMAAVLILGLSGGLAGLLDFGWMPAKAMLFVCTAVLAYFSKAGELFLKLPGAVRVTGRPEAWQMAAYYLILAACAQMAARMPSDERPVKKKASGRNWRRRQKAAVTAGFFICISILFFPLQRPAEVTILDVGQGDGIYIRTSDGTDVIIDGGSNDVKQAGTYRIVPFLKFRGVAEIDYWFVSHLDQDHISGLKEAADSGYRIGRVIFAKGVLKDEAYEKLLKKLAEWQIQTGFLAKGDILSGQNASFRALAPDETDAANDRNAQSLVLLYEDCGFSAFFPGDISLKEEQKLLKDEGLTKTVLYKAAHHGSKHSNSLELLSRLSPDISLISCSKENEYGHPGKEAVEHMQQCGSRVYYTMHSGQIRVRWGKNGLSVKAFSAKQQGT